MLNDNERKVLQVFINLTMKRTPSVSDICRKTGKSKEAVTQALTALHQKGYIWRNHKGEIEFRRDDELQRPEWKKERSSKAPHPSQHPDWW